MQKKAELDLDIEKELNNFALKQTEIEAGGEPVDIPGGLVNAGEGQMQQ